MNAHQKTGCRPFLGVAFLLLFLVHPALRGQVVLTNASAADLLSAIRAGGHIRLNSPGIFEFTNAIPVSTDVTIEGLHFRSNILSGGSLTRIFVVEPTGKLRLRNVSIVSGRITPTTITNSIIQEYAGAAIYNDRGLVQAVATVFSSHSIVGPNGVAGADNASFDGGNGEAAPDVLGGAIFNNNGAVILHGCLLHRNDLLGGAGGKGGNGGAFGNGRNGGDGGSGGSAMGSAIYSAGGLVQLNSSYFATNSAFAGVGAQGGAGGGVLGTNGDLGPSGQGSGAVAVTGGVLMIDSTTFEGNRVLGGAGTNGLPSRNNFPGQDGAPGGPALGAAIYATVDLTITNSTFVRNTVIGGSGGGGGAGGPTTFGSRGGAGGAGGPAYGGGLYLGQGWRATIINSTFHDNILSPGQGGPGGPGSGVTGQPGSRGPSGDAAGADLYIAGNADVANSIFSFSRGGGGLFGNINDLGANISSDNSFHLGGERSLNNVDPALMLLRFNGGPAPTMGLRLTSPALGRALSRYSPEVDARGVTRGSSPDVGAYEVPAAPVLRQSSPGTNSTNFHLRFTMTAPEARVVSTTNLLTGPWLLRTNIVNATGTPIALDVPATNRMEFFRVLIP